MGKQTKNEQGYVIYFKKAVYDTDLPASWYEKVGGKSNRIWCPYTRRWLCMLNRTICDSFIQHNPSYVDCTICEDWLIFSNFKRWVDEQPNKEWINCHLDKDIFVRGNKHYCESSVVFVDKVVNTFITDSKSIRGNTMLGVTENTKQLTGRRYKAFCRNPFTKLQENLGCFYEEYDAHRVWQARKHELACELAKLQEDKRVSEALMNRYHPSVDWTCN